MNLRPIYCSLIVTAAVSAASAQGSIIVDNGENGFSTVGTWNTYDQGTQLFGEDALTNSTGSGQDTASWFPDISEAGWYDVYGWWTTSGGGFRARRVMYELAGNAVQVNQSLNGQRWNFLGTYYLDPTSPTPLILSDDSPDSLSVVMADAARFEPTSQINGQPPTAASQVYSTQSCSLCADWELPGTHVPHPDSEYYIISDVPEKFGTEGILYSTREQMPEQSASYPPAPYDTQISTGGFQYIDDDFDVFMFHITSPGDGSRPRRIVVYAENVGTNPVDISPMQVLVTDGVVGTVHEMESNLGSRFIDGDFDDFGIPDTVTIQPGGGEVIGFSKKFGLFPSGTYTSQNVNCFGRLRGLVDGTDPQLHISIVALDTTSADVAPNLTQIKNDTATLVNGNVGAQELEDLFDFDNNPPGCALRRSTGVFPHRVWQSDSYVHDVKGIGGVRRFSMGLDDLRTAGCPGLDQAVDALRYPRFLRDESIGNYMTDHEIRIDVVNTGTEVYPFDINFGKTGADIGLVYQLAWEESIPPATPAQTGWAGPFQSETKRSFLTGGPRMINPGERVPLRIRFQILGNSSTPFSIEIPDLRGPVFDRVIAQPSQADAGESVAITFVASEPLSGNPTVTVNGQAAALTGASGSNYAYSYTVQESDPSGFADIEITGSDSSGNAGSTLSDTSLQILGGAGVDMWMVLGATE